MAKFYKHYKTGDLYTIVGVATFEEDLEEVVIYKANEGGKTWVRKSAVFFETVQHEGAEVPRFKEVEVVTVTDLWKNARDLWTRLCQEVPTMRLEPGMRMLGYDYINVPYVLGNDREDWPHDLGMRYPDFEDEKTLSIVMDKIAGHLGWEGYAPVKIHDGGEDLWVANPSAAALRKRQTYYPNPIEAALRMVYDRNEGAA